MRRIAGLVVRRFGAGEAGDGAGDSELASDEATKSATVCRLDPQGAIRRSAAARVNPLSSWGSPRGPGRLGARPLEKSALLSLHEAAGARLRTGGGPATPLTFGDVPGEYRAGLEGCAVFDETDRGRVDVVGDEAAIFLHRILASDVRVLAAGAGQPSLLLSSRGKVLFAFDLFRSAEGAWISVAAGRAEALLAAFDTYLFAEKVKLANATARHAPLALVGPRAPAVVRSVTGIDVPAEDHAWIRGGFQGGEAIVARTTVAGSTGCLVDAGPERAAELWTRLRDAGATPAGVIARDILRVEAGQGLYGEDVDDSVYPQEARLESAFSLSKGCFIGQEVVAKIDTYGGLNKRLVALRISHDDPVPVGTRLFRDEDGEHRDLGVVTSWAYSFVLDAGLALAYVKRKHQKTGTRFQVGETSASAEIVPIPVRPGAVPVTGEFE